MAKTRDECTVPGSRDNLAARAMHERMKVERAEGKKRCCRNCREWVPGSPVGTCRNGYTSAPADKCQRWKPRPCGGGQ